MSFRKIGCAAALAAVMLGVLGIGESRAYAAQGVLDPGPPVNVSRLPGSQCEPSISVNPTNPSNLFVAGYDHSGALFGAYSLDGGATWNPSGLNAGLVADGPDALPPAGRGARTAFDRFGDLLLCYSDSDETAAELAISVDSGRSFALLASISHVADEPALTVGGGSVWVSFLDDNGFIAAAGAPISGPGKIGPFIPSEEAPSTRDRANFSDIAIGPAGEVMVAWQDGLDNDGPSRICVSVDPDGSGPAGFGPAVTAAQINVQAFQPTAAQPTRGIDASPGLAWDESGGPHSGRVYLIYTDQDQSKVPQSGDSQSGAAQPGVTFIQLRYSDDGGQTWSAPARVDGGASSRSQFLPRLALDPTTGAVAAAWYDCRDDDRITPATDSDRLPNDEPEFFTAASVDGGATFLPAVQVSGGPSRAAGAACSVDFGDYSGLAFYGGAIYPCWADNSNSDGANPNGNGASFDIYSARVKSSAPLNVLAGGLSLISVPFDDLTTATDAAALLNIPPSPGGWAPIAWYDPLAGRYLVYPDLPGRMLAPGRGYWVLEQAPLTSLVAGDPVQSPFMENVQAGWNLIGDPFSTPVSFGNIQVTLSAPGSDGPVPAVPLDKALSAGTVGGVWDWNAAMEKYAPATLIQPYRGYWLYLDPAAAGPMAALTFQL